MLFALERCREDICEFESYCIELSTLIRSICDVDEKVYAMYTINN